VRQGLSARIPALAAPFRAPCISFRTRGWGAGLLLHGRPTLAAARESSTCRLRREHVFRAAVPPALESNFAGGIGFDIADMPLGTDEL
jgi:hypothetical protein